MEILQMILRALLLWLGFIKTPDFLMRVVTDHPDRVHMAPGWIYVVGGPGYQKWAYLLCPSGNGDVIQLSLQPKHRPRWEVTRDILGRPTVHPSVRQTEGSYAHFWIRNGAVFWCDDTGRRHDFLQAWRP
jgi:hypothetical protein